MFRLLDLAIELPIDALHEDEGVGYDAACDQSGQGVDFGFVLVQSEDKIVAEVGKAEGGDDSESRRGSDTAIVCSLPFTHEERVGRLSH